MLMNDPFDREECVGQERRHEWNDGWEGADTSYRRPPRKGRGLLIFSILMLLIALLCLGGALWIRANLRQNDPAPNQPEAPTYPQQSTQTNRGDDALYGREDAPELTLYSHADSALFGVQESGLSIPEIAQRVSPAVVGVVSDSGTAVSYGSGIIISENGYLVTNAHVIEGGKELSVITKEGEEFTASVVGSDRQTDLAVLKVDATGLPSAVFGDSDELVVGELAVAIGNPMSMELFGSVTAGVISALDRQIVMEDRTMVLLQTDAAINPGNSGGPLINEYGQVIGINSSRLSSSTYNGIGFAIPINNALPVVEDLIRYGYVTGRVKLGITYYTISEVVGAMSGYTPGLLVYSVDTTMDIYQKGIRAGDIITEIDGTPVTTKDAVKQALEGKSPGYSILLTCYRTTAAGGSTFSVEVILGEDTGNSDTSSYSTETGGSVGVPTALPHSGT